ncbi:hypothetical protein CPB83DRAFT_190513 [Crepidotus variabilis]|uniref:Uncharacterized protein n=1 Tax=Crepidotus variabilis TaxID=179855 RepID=A0A9P6EJJ0_9AGAR|nr:hypothetical protein CPB83DRAFT_190513 [Crepidotus variabilis]
MYQAWVQQTLAHVLSRVSTFIFLLLKIIFEIKFTAFSALVTTHFSSSVCAVYNFNRRDIGFLPF